MLEQGKQLGITPIKCDNREGTEKLKNVHYRINELLYKNSGKYLFKQQAEELYQALCELGKELAALEVPDKANAKKSELLSKLRTVCNSLNVYRKQNQTFEDVENMQKAINFAVHLFIEAKENLTPEKAVELLKLFKELKNNVYPFDEDLKTVNLCKANEQLIRYINDLFDM